MAATMEDIKKVVNGVDLINDQIKQLEAKRDADLLRIDVMDNERALFTEKDTRDAEAFRAELLTLSNEDVPMKGRDKKLSDWSQTIDPNLAFSGWGIDNENDVLFPAFSVVVPEVVTDEFVRNMNFFARVTTPVQPARLRISNRAFTIGYEATLLKFDGEACENAFTVCGSFRSGNTEVKTLLATLRRISERAFSSWNNPLN